MDALKHKVLLILVSFALFSCSNSIIEEHASNEGKKVVHQTASTYYFPLSEGEQGRLFDEFIQLCFYPEFNEFIIGPKEESWVGYKRRHAILNKVFADEEYELFGAGSEESPNARYNYMAIKEILDVYGSEFEEIIENYCTSNYLNFNIYIPHYDEAIQCYAAGDPIYVVNALYSEALDKVVIDEYEDGDGNVIPVYGYHQYYIVGSGETPEPAEFGITEEFCRSHIVYVLSFRDEIVGWNHFAKGTQSVSDWLITTVVEYQGYGCTTRSELSNEDCFQYGVALPIRHSKKAFDRRNCDEHYDHFCKLGKPETQNYDIDELPFLFESDPYRTSWMPLELSSNEQYIYVRDNGGIDLEGHDFYVQDTTLVMDDGTLIYVPAQISKYDVEKEAQCLVVNYDLW